MANPTGDSNDEVLKLDFHRRLMLQFRGSVVTSDAGLLAYRELDDALGLSTMTGETLADARTDRNGRHALVGLLRQSVFGRLAGYEDVNDAERLRHDPAMRWIVGGKAAQSSYWNLPSHSKSPRSSQHGFNHADCGVGRYYASKAEAGLAEERGHIGFCRFLAPSHNKHRHIKDFTHMRHVTSRQHHFDDRVNGRPGS